MIRQVLRDLDVEVISMARDAGDLLTPAVPVGS